MPDQTPATNPLQEAIRLSIDPGAINAYVAQVILQSTVGAELHNAIESVLKRLCETDYRRQYTTGWENLVAVHIHEAVTLVLREQYHERLLEEMRKQLTPERIEALMATELKKMYFAFSTTRGD